MKIQLALCLDYTGSAAELRERLLAWTMRGGFRLKEETAERWLFRRGSEWGSLLVMFDVHGLYCEIEVRHLPLSRQVAISMECRSWFHIETPGDRTKLQKELDSVRFYLYGDEEKRDSIKDESPHRHGIERADDAIEK